MYTRPVPKTSKQMPWLLMAFVLFSAKVSMADRGRPKVTDKTVVSDKNTRLRGLMHGIDKYYNLPSRVTFTKLSREYGFNVLHLYSNDPAKQYGDDMNKLQTLVNWAGEDGMYVCLTYASGEYHKYDTAAATRWWKDMAPRFKDRAHVFYETTNEPNSSVNLQVSLYKTIRSLAPKTLICVFGTDANVSVTNANAAKAAGVDFSNAAISYHDYHGENPTSGFPCIVTEFKTGYYTGKEDYSGPMAQEHLKRIKKFEEQGVSWMVFLDIGQLGGNTYVGNFKNDIDAYGIRWVPDYGSWPQASGSTPALLQPLKRYSSYERRISTVLSIKQNSISSLPVIDLRGARLQSCMLEAAGIRIRRP